MIVEPDFLSHWKTQALVDELSDPMAPLYVIALWSHCQQRRTATFEDLPPNALKAICRYKGDGEKLLSALTSSGFIDPTERGFEVHGWAERNVKLLRNWKNGSKGGRPKGDNPGEGGEGAPKPDPSPPDPEAGGEAGEGETKPPEGDGEEGGKPQKSRTPQSEDAKRIAHMMGRRETTAWTDKERRALRAISPIDREDMEVVEAYYLAERSSPDSICRKDVCTLLNNWPGEVDRARAWAAKRRGPSSGSGTSPVPLSLAAYSKSDQEDGFTKLQRLSGQSADSDAPSIDVVEVEEFQLAEGEVL